MPKTGTQETLAPLTILALGQQDLEALYDYIAEFDGVAKASQALDRLMEVAGGLARLPERGSYPRELLALGSSHWASRITVRRHSSPTG